MKIYRHTAVCTNGLDTTVGTSLSARKLSPSGIDKKRTEPVIDYEQGKRENSTRITTSLIGLIIPTSSKMKSVLALRKSSSSTNNNNKTSSAIHEGRDAESTLMDLDDTKSVMSSATTTSSRIGGFLKSKVVSFSVPKLKHNRTKTNEIPSQPGDDVDGEDDEQYHENDDTRAAAKMFKETTNTSGKNKIADGDLAKLRATLKETQQELNGEKLKTQLLKKELENDQEASRKRITELRSALERERENYQSMISGAGVDEAVRRQADTIQELQALTEALQLRIEQLESDYNESERKCELAEQASKAETETLNDRVHCLETENVALKKFIAEQQQQQRPAEELKAIEREKEMLRQRVLALEAESMRSVKRSDSGGASDRLKALEAENAELKRTQTQETKSLQAKISSLENDLRANSSKKGSESELAAIKVRLAEKEAELAAIATGAEEELARLDGALKAQQRQREEADAQVRSLHQELNKVKEEMAKQTAYWKEKLEHDVEYQRAADAAKQLLKQKKITKTEYDQVMKAAQEASRVWTQ